MNGQVYIDPPYMQFSFWSLMVLQMLLILQDSWSTWRQASRACQLLSQSPS